MANTRSFIKRMNDYKKCMRVLECANLIYIDEIENFEFKKISKYNKSKDLYAKVVKDFKLVDELISKRDILNASNILRSLYENIIYIIATSHDKNIKITLDIQPKELRKVLEDNCNVLFTDYFKSTDFNEIYKYMCKIVHPCSLKELISYMGKTIKYKNYLLANLKYMMLTIEYIYLNFLNKKIGNDESKFDLNFIDLCTYANLVNINYFINDIDKSQIFIKKYLYYDTNNRYVIENQDKLKEVYDTLIDKKELIEEDIKELAKDLDKQINDSKYKEMVTEILSGKYPLGTTWEQLDEAR